MKDLEKFEPLGSAEAAKQAAISAAAADATLKANAAESAAKAASRPATWTPTATDVGAIPAAEKGKPGGVPTLNEDGKVVQEPSTDYLPRAGGKMTGPIELPADPSEPLHAVPKQYADAVGRNAMAIRKTLPVAAGQTIAAGDVVDVEYVSTPGTFGALSVGSTFQINENGAPVEYLVVQQGKPSSLYDDSCDGTWLLRKELLPPQRWNTSDVNDYGKATIHTELNTTFISSLDTLVKNAIKQVEIPYRPGLSGQLVGTTQCKAFLLSAYEVGWSHQDGTSNIPIDGVKLSYFESGRGAAANNKRIAMLGNVATIWFTRSPETSGSQSAFAVNVDGSTFNKFCASSNGIRPCIILPRNFSTSNFVPARVNEQIIKSNESSQAIALQSGGVGQTIDIVLSGIAEAANLPLGKEITSDGVYGYCFDDGWLQVFPKHRPGVRVEIGEYEGTGTNGASNPNTLVFDGKPLAVLLYGKYNKSKFVQASMGQAIFINTMGFKDSFNPGVYTKIWQSMNSGGTNNNERYILFAENTFKWYSYAPPLEQFNDSGLVYGYIAFVLE